MESGRRDVRQGRKGVSMSPGHAGRAAPSFGPRSGHRPRRHRPAPEPCRSPRRQGRGLAEIASDRASTRHCTDFVVLANLVSARDFRGTELVRKDRTRLREMLTYCRKDDSAMSVQNAVEALDRLERAAKLNG